MEPIDAPSRRAVKPIIRYPDDNLPRPNLALYQAASKGATLVDEVTIPPRDARCFTVPAGHFSRITSVEGPHVGDLNLWNAENLTERFYSGKTRALHGTHITTGQQMWSSFPTLRPMVTIVKDTLSWYGINKFGGSVHDVIGTRCAPHINTLLSGGQCHHCCHSNLIRALATHTGLPLKAAEPHIHDVLNVFIAPVSPAIPAGIL